MGDLKCLLATVRTLNYQFKRGSFYRPSIMFFNLYHEYGHLLAPIEAVVITSSHRTPAKPPPETPLGELKTEDNPIN